MSDIRHLRSEIDRVDTELLALIAQRLRLAEQVRDAKRGAPTSTSTSAETPIWRPAREESLVRELVAEGEVNPPLVSRIWAELVSASLALQGPMAVHIGLEGDRLRAWTLVRDRFGAALPFHTYPTTSAALAAAHADPQGVAVVPSPGGMVGWWAALAPGGAMADMKILAGLPRVRNAAWPDDDWPRAVAVAGAEPTPSGADRWLVVSRAELAGETLRGEAGGWHLYALPEAGEHAVVGILPDPLPHE